jgi:hypothetical protein
MATLPSNNILYFFHNNENFLRHDDFINERIYLVQSFVGSRAW